MATAASRVRAPDDGKSRLISICVGAVLLPSLALSCVSVRFARELTGTRLHTDHRRAETTLYYIERDLVQGAHAKALEAARAVGTETLLDGRLQAVRQALAGSGLDESMFEALHLEAPSIRISGKAPVGRDERPEDVRERGGPPGRGQVPWLGSDGRPVGMLRFACAVMHGRLVKYFEREFVA